MGTRVLNLGAGGFIGAHLTERLLQDGYDVVGVDSHTDKVTELLDHPNFTFVEEDIRNKSFDLQGLVQSSDVVLDLIAHANPGLYVKMPLDVFRLNFDENMNIAKACVEHGRRLIQFSSCEVYGKTVVALLGDRLPDPDNPDYATFSEDTTDMIMGPVCKHRWIYACAKQLLERVIYAYGLECNLNYTIIRPFNFIGPKIDYLPSDTEGIPRVFSYFMEALLHGEPMQLVGGGSNRRCYTYIGDAIDCIVRIIENPNGVCDREIFNVGATHNETTIRAMAEQMRDIYKKTYLRPNENLSEIVNVDPEDFYGPGYEDSDRRIPDNRKARELLGWDPHWTLQDLLEKTMAYYAKGHPVFDADKTRTDQRSLS